MDIQSSEFWLRSILVDLNLPQNQDRAADFINWFAEHYVLPIKVDHTCTKSDNMTTEFVIVSIDMVQQTFKRTIKNFIFSIYTSEWKKVN